MISLMLACGTSTPAPEPPAVDTAPPNTDLGRERLPVAPRPGFVRHACAVVQGGQVWCWGGNGAGQLGRATFGEALLAREDLVSVYQHGRHLDGTSAAQEPAPVSVGLSAVAVVAGAAHSCALDAQGAVWCWGRNVEGQLGPPVSVARLDRRGWTGDVPSPVRVPLQQPVSALFAGGLSTCASSATGTARCWGAGFDGFEEVAEGVVDLWVDYGQLCLLREGGGVTCRGRGLPEELVREGARELVVWREAVCTSDHGPVVRCGEAEVRLPGPVRQLSASRDELCALADEQAWCWTEGTAPSRVAQGVQALAAGRDTHCTLDGEGVSGCWRRSDAGAREQASVPALAGVRTVALSR